MLTKCNWKRLLLGVIEKNDLPSIGKNIIKNNEHVKKNKPLRHNAL